MLKQVYKRRKILRIAGAAAAAVALTIAAVVLLSKTTLTAEQWEDLYKNGTYFTGIKVDGIDVGGMTMPQANKLVRQHMQQRISEIHVTVDYNGQPFIIGQDDMDIADNVDATLKEALAVAREGNRLEIGGKIKEIEKNGLNFSTDYTVNPLPAKSRIADIALAVDVPATNAAVQINKDDRKKRFSYTEEAAGYKVDQDALYNEVERQVRMRAYGTVKLPIVDVPPTVTKAELVANTVLRASASTSFGHSPYNRESRVFNIKKAVKQINGYVIPAGQEFSTNTVLGPRVYELGWQAAPAVVRGSSEDQAGGGVCQVSTTMYNAVLKADLEIVNRQGHSIKLSYVAGGLDATINTGTIDFIYRNNTDHDIYIFCWVNSGAQTVNFEVYGAPFPSDYDEIRLSSEKLETLEPPGDMIVMVDKSKPYGYEEVTVKRREGFIYAAYKHYYKNGEEVKKPELIGKTKYKPYAGEKIVGPTAPASVSQPPLESAAPADNGQPGNSEVQTGA